MLKLSHSLEHVLGIVDDISEVILIKDFHTIFFDVISPYGSFNEGVASAVSHGIEGKDQLGELV